MSYLKQFVIGSSYIVFAPFFYAVQNNKFKTYEYYTYTLIAPVWFGLWNIISLILSNILKLNLKERFLLISILSSISIMLIATYGNAYKYTKEEWIKYYLHIFIKYMIVWNLIIYNIEKNV